MTKLQELAGALAPLADELGDLDLELQPFKASIKRAESLRAVLRGAYKSEAPGGSYQVHGERWSVLLGPMGNESVVDTAALLAAVGPAVFTRLANVSLKSISEHCSAEVAGAVVSTRMSGSRSLALAPAPPKITKAGKRARS